MTRQGWWAVGLLSIVFLLIYFTSTAFKTAPLRPKISFFEKVDGSGLDGKVKPPPLASKLFFKAKPLIVYVEKEPLPESWLAEWKEDTGYEVKQRVFIPEEGKDLPLDGDVYSVSPRYFQKLKEKQELIEFKEDEFWNGVNSVFGGHSFDLDNKWTRPWRWSPYFFYVKQTESGASPQINQWWKNANALWPRDEELLEGLRAKEVGKSANALPRSTDILESIRRNLSDESQCWESIRDGKIEMTLLPAFYRIKNSDVPLIALKVSKNGTLIQFDVLAVSIRTLKPELAKEFVNFLMSSSVQDRLLSETGYFSTHGDIHEKMKASPVALPNGSWFEHSEFLFKPNILKKEKSSEE